MNGIFQRFEKLGKALVFEESASFPSKQSLAQSIFASTGASRGGSAGS